MKPLILLLCLMIFSPFVIHAQLFYKHKSEAKIAQMTPAQRVDEWNKEYLNHRYNVLDEQRSLIRKYVTRDGLKALPRIIEIIDEYDPTRFREGKGSRGERYDACWIMLGFIDNFAVRLRASEEGRRAIEALGRSIQRMRAAGYGQKEQHEWEQHGRFDLAVMQLEEAKGINDRDEDIKNTFRFEYKIILSNAELVELSNFLTEHYPDYPSWSEREGIQDDTQLSPAGYSVRIDVLKKPERYYEVYLEFKKTKR